MADDGGTADPAFTQALGMYCLAACVANVCMGISGFGSGIIMVLGWQIANMLQLDGTVKFSQSIDWLACLAFGLPNLLCYCAGLWFLLNVLVQSGTVLIHALGIFILFFAIVRIAADCNLLPGSNFQGTRPFGVHTPGLMVGWVITGVVSGLLSGIFGVGGPPTMIFMTMARLDKSSMRSTNQLVNVGLQLVRIVMLHQTRVLNFGEHNIGCEISALMLAGIAGAVLGDWLHGSVPTAWVVRMILVLLLMASTSMLVDLKSGSTSAHVMVLAMTSVVLSGLLAILARQARLTFGEQSTQPRKQQPPLSREPPIGARLCDDLFFPGGRRRQAGGVSGLESLSEYHQLSADFGPD